VTALRLLPCLLLAAMFASADLATIRKQPDAGKRADMAAEYAYGSVETARTAYVAGKDEEYKKVLDEIRDASDLAYTSLKESGKSARRSPKYFKRVEARMGATSKRLDALAQEVSFDDRQTVLDLKKYVNDLQDKIVEQIMHD
jgi:hypothetical protein